MRSTFAGSAVDDLVGKRSDVFVPLPAAGAEWKYTFPGGAMYRVASLFFILTASAQVAERQPTIVIEDGDGRRAFQSECRAGVKASGSQIVSAGVGIGSQTGAVGPNVTIQTPEILIPAGWRIGTRTVGLQTEDTYTTIRILLEELFDYEPGQAAGKHHHPHHEGLEVDVHLA